MRSIFIAVVAIALACWGPAVAAEAQQRRVTFASGASAKTLSGSITGDQSLDYVLGGKAGQTMTVTLKTAHGANSFNVLPPGSAAAIGRGDLSDNAWTGTLPVDGDYRVRVFLMRAAARRNETATYTLTVGITGAGAAAGQAAAGDAKVAGTPYHATGKVPCAFGPDRQGAVQCSFGVIRGAPGNAEVRLAPAGFDVVLHPDKVETVLIFGANSVRSANAEDKVSAEKQGDSWFIDVNDVEHFTIPEAVIKGG